MINKKRILIILISIVGLALLLSLLFTPNLTLLQTTVKNMGYERFTSSLGEYDSYQRIYDSEFCEIKVSNVYDLSPLTIDNACDPNEITNKELYRFQLNVETSEVSYYTESPYGYKEITDEQTLNEYKEVYNEEFKELNDEVLRNYKNELKGEGV